MKHRLSMAFLRLLTTLNGDIILSVRRVFITGIMKEARFVFQFVVLFLFRLGTTEHVDDTSDELNDGLTNDQAQGKRDGGDHEPGKGVLLFAVAGWDDGLEPHSGNH